MSRKADLVLTQLTSNSLLQEYLLSTESDLTSNISPSSSYQLSVSFKPKVVKVNLQELESQINILENQDTVTQTFGSNQRSIFAMGVLERNSYWESKRQKKVEAKRLEKTEKELDGCTFKPKVNNFKVPESLNSSMRAPKGKNYTEMSRNRSRLRSTPRDSGLSYKVIHSKR